MLLPLTLILSCGNGDSPGEGEVYEVKGRYLSTDMRGESISLIHETIPGAMNAMRMSFRIEDASGAQELETGDVIRFEGVRTDAGWYARNIEVLPEDTELDLPEELKGVGKK